MAEEFTEWELAGQPWGAVGSWLNQPLAFQSALLKVKEIAEEGGGGGGGPAAAGTLTGTTLAANVVNSSLTSLGTLATLTVTAPIAGSVTGNSATATSLQTARTINGTSFNGTANITVAAAAGTLTGNTLASGVTASSLTSVGTLAALTVTAPIAGSVTGNAATVTTNANLTGVVTSVGNATAIADAALSIAKTSGLQAALDSKAGKAVPVKVTASNYTVGTTDPNELYGGVIYVTAAATLTLPAVVSGASFTVITVGAFAVSVDPNAADLIVLDGTALSDGDKITNLSHTGDVAVLTYYDATGWYASTNGWIDGN